MRAMKVADDSVYRAERVRESLACEPEVSELGIEVVIVEEEIVLRGTLASDRRKAQVLAHVRRLCPDLEIRDELKIHVLRGPKTETV
jgi:hypothetical protein